MSIDASKYTRHLSPGKFEGAHQAAEYFYEQMLNGDGETLVHEEEASHSAEVFLVSAEESEAFDIPMGTWITLFEDSYGNVWINQADSRESAEKAYAKWAGIDLE